MRTGIAAVLSGQALVCSPNRLSYSFWMRLPLKSVGYRCVGSPRFRYRAPEFTVVVTGLAEIECECFAAVKTLCEGMRTDASALVHTGMLELRRKRRRVFARIVNVTQATVFCLGMGFLCKAHRLLRCDSGVLLKLLSAHCVAAGRAPLASS